MGAWRTRFVLELGPDPGAAAQFAAAAPAWWRRFGPGCFVRVRDDRVKAFCKDFSAQPTWPVLRGHLVADESGARIEGTLSWALQKSWPLVHLFVACVSLYGAVGSGRDDDKGSALVLAGCAVATLALAGWCRLGERRERTVHEQELRDGLVGMLAR